MENTKKYIVIGKVGTTYGIQGWLKIHSFTEIKGDIMDYDPWYIKEGANWKPIAVEDVREHGKSVIAKLAGWNTPEQARLLTGKEIAVLDSQLPLLAKDEYYWNDLIGLTVIDQHQKTLGTVIYLLETGSNDVLVVKGEKDFAIPFLLGDVIKNVNIAERVIHVDWEII